MKNQFSKINTIISVPIIVIVIGYLLLVSVDLIPREWIDRQAWETAEILSEQGTYPMGFLDGFFLDNWTDADCVSISINRSSTNPFYNALHGYEYGSADDPQPASIEALQSAVEGRATIILDHSYLWNGFQIWLRPLLIRYNITEIRMLMYIIMIVVSTLLCVMLVIEKRNILGFIPFLISITFFNFQMESLSILFFNDLFIAIVGSISFLVLYRINDLKYTLEVFALIGAVVAFSSMFILPLTTLCFPLIVLFSLVRGCNDKLKKLVKYSISWLYGYSVVMISKLIISKIFIDAPGISRVASYLGKDKFTLYDRIYRTLIVINKIYIRSKVESDFMLSALLMLMLFVILKKRDNLIHIKDTWVLMVIALFPVLWCLVCTGHIGHGWTYWNYSVSIFAVMEIIWDMCDFRKDQFNVMRSENNSDYLLNQSFASIMTESVNDSVHDDIARVVKRGITILMPCLNEEKTLKACIIKARHSLDNMGGYFAERFLLQTMAVRTAQ